MAYSVQAHINLKRVASVVAAPDGTWLAAAVQKLDRDGVKYAADLWKIPLDGSPPVQLTSGDSHDSAPCFRDDGGLGFLSDRRPTERPADEDSDKRKQVWILPAAGGEPRQVTDEPLGVAAFRFAASASRLVLMAPVLHGVAHDKQRQEAADRGKKGPSARRFTHQPVRHWDQWLHENPDMANMHVIACDGGGANRTDLTPAAEREFSIDPDFDVSDDGRFTAVLQQHPGADRILEATVLWIDIESGSSRTFGAAEAVGHEGVRISRDGSRIATVRSFRSAGKVMHPHLAIIDTATGDVRQVAEQWEPWPHVEGWMPDGKRVLVTADDEGHVPVFAIDMESGAVERWTSRSSAGTHSNLSPLPDGRVAGIRSTLLRAPECFVVDAAPESEPKCPGLVTQFDAAAWAETEHCSVPSTDGAPIQFFVVKPKGAAAPLPALMWIHGGPIGMSADGWHWRWNPLLAVAQGYAVVLPNPRGSTGFGQDFVQGIWGNAWGAQCYRDLMCVADEMERRSDMDSSRMMAMGGSFGGYMTNWIGTQTDRFRCLVTHASIFTMAQFTGTTDHPPWWYLEMGGEDPYADPERFERYAPVRHVRNWKTPTLIIHGEIDYRCPVGEGLNLFEALQYRNVRSELLIFPDEGHWILKPKNIVAWYDAVLEFLGRYMGTHEDAKPANA